ncbi:hypothetical protein [Flammeovirga sp. EKP202]|uniref:hypothetical protein n=1 Tax=Flammeovirga sp. EKP202 TaxID=2770592 RepID=UPI00165F0219|nr:hypothetical protein [Flammeovirga sp. EKP202]MBD0404356.1 hypothetical protein [Flammeovirga sp. EKP202]
MRLITIIFLLLATSASYAQIGIGDTVTVAKSKYKYIVTYISVTTHNKIAYELLNLKNDKMRWVLDEELEYQRKHTLKSKVYRKGEEEEFENFIQ